MTFHRIGWRPARAEQGGGHDEEAQQVEDRLRGRAGWKAWQEDKTEWNALARAWNDMSGQGRPT